MIRRLLRKRMSRGLREALWIARYELRAQRRHRAGVRRARRWRTAKGLQLHLGCGSNAKPGWINVDLWSPSADLSLDLREDLPFASQSAAMIYSEHVFEHLSYPHETSRLLGEALRVLAPDGRFSVGVPDTAWPLIAYVTDDDEYFRIARERWHPADATTRMHQINFHFRQGSEHKYAYDAETLTEVLSGAGFVSVARREFDPALDSESRRLGTLYVDGYRTKRHTAAGSTPALAAASPPVDPAT